MSYILDALKKSEGERVVERDVPDWKTSHKGDYTPPPQGPTRQQIISIALLSAVLVSLLIGASFWLFSPKPAPLATNDKPSPLASDSGKQKPKRVNSAQFASDQLATTTNSDATKSTNKSTKTTFEKFSQVQQDAQSVAKTSPNPAAAKKTKTTKSVKAAATTNSSDSSKASKGSVVFAEEPLNQAQAKSKKKKGVKKPKVVALSALPANIRRALPAIGFSGHVYSSEDPKQSSVMINGRKMKEGTSVTHELVLEKITESGAQFSFRGHHFYLGALVDWQFNGK